MMDQSKNYVDLKDVNSFRVQEGVLVGVTYSNFQGKPCMWTNDLRIKNWGRQMLGKHRVGNCSKNVQNQL